MLLRMLAVAMVGVPALVLGIILGRFVLPQPMDECHAAVHAHYEAWLSGDKRAMDAAGDRMIKACLSDYKFKEE